MTNRSTGLRRTPLNRGAWLWLAVAALVAIEGTLLAQTALSQLGLTETAARRFVLNEIKGPATGRRSPIAIAGTRAFLKLPPPARGPAATALFAWAKSYVSSPAFTTAYTAQRKDSIPPERTYSMTIDEAANKELNDLLAGLEQAKQMAASMPPTEGAKMLEEFKKQEAQFRSPEMAQQIRARIEADRAGESGSVSAMTKSANDKYPADPRQLFARRLREFLDATADANFSARTISLTGGADGIEFVNPPDRDKSWLWQEAVIAGQEATTAARAAAEAWLKEIP